MCGVCDVCESGCVCGVCVRKGVWCVYGVCMCERESVCVTGTSFLTSYSPQ